MMFVDVVLETYLHSVEDILCPLVFTRAFIQKNCLAVSISTFNSPWWDALPLKQTETFRFFSSFIIRLHLARCPTLQTNCNVMLFAVHRFIIIQLSISFTKFYHLSQPPPHDLFSYTDLCPYSAFIMFQLVSVEETETPWRSNLWQDSTLSMLVCLKNTCCCWTRSFLLLQILRIETQWRGR